MNVGRGTTRPVSDALVHAGVAEDPEVVPVGKPDAAAAVARDRRAFAVSYFDFTGALRIEPLGDAAARAFAPRTSPCAPTGASVAAAIDATAAIHTTIRLRTARPLIDCADTAQASVPYSWYKSPRKPRQFARYPTLRRKCQRPESFGPDAASLLRKSCESLPEKLSQNTSESDVRRVARVRTRHAPAAEDRPPARTRRAARVGGRGRACSSTAGISRAGYLGVDAFFVLSGFLITSLLLVEQGNRGTYLARALLGPPGAAAAALHSCA